MEPTKASDYNSRPLTGDEHSMSLDDSWTRRFGGIARLYGQANGERIAAAHFVVIGLGGVGSWAAEALARSGVGALTLIDPDEVCLSNVNRQLVAISGSVGEAKAEVLAARIREIHPDCRVTTHLEYLTSDNLTDLLPTCDGILDAIDQIAPKCALLNHAKRSKITLIATGGAGGQRDPRLITSGDLSQTINDPLLSKVRATLRRRYGFPRDGRKFGIECVYSTEQLSYPAADGQTCSAKGEAEGPLRLDCASGFGAVTMVTASFGMVAAARLLERYLSRSSAS